MKSYEKTTNGLGLRLAPSRFGELPTLIPRFNSRYWPKLNRRKLREYESSIQNTSINSDFCIHIHVFYAEELETILKILTESLDIISAIIITLPSSRRGIRQDINKILNKYLGSHEVVIIETENVGRNIKPLLVDAWEYIAKYKYCLHLHTKRTKGPQRLWPKWLKSVCSSIATRQKILSSQYFLNNTDD